MIDSEGADQVSRSPVPQRGREIVLEYSTEIESSRRRMIVLGFLIIVFGFGGLTSWAALAPLQSAAIAPGVIKVASERKTVQHLEGGIVKDILVREGDVVEAGQVLIRLDGITAETRKELYQGKLDAYLANLARLHAERDEADEIDFPAELIERRNDPQVASIVEGEQALFRTRRESLEGERNVLQQRISQLEEQIAGENTQIRSATTQLSLISEELTAAETLFKKGIYAKPKYLKLKRDVARLEGDIGGHRSRIAQIHQQIGEIKLRILDIDKKRREEINQQLQSLQNNVFDVRERLSAARDTLERINIRAPLDGTVVGLKVHTIGGVIQAGVNILDIVPKDDALIVEAQVRPDDIDIVHEGLASEVRLTAFNMRTTPTLPGTLTHVSADRFQPATAGLQPFFIARVEIDPSHTGDLQLYPGMPAEVYVLTGKSTALDYILRPIKDAIGRGLREQ